MFKSIVTAVDGSAHARKAVDIASDLTAKYGARLTIIHVVGSGPFPLRSPTWPKSSTW